MSEISSIVNISMLEGVSRNMPFNTPNEQQSLKGASKKTPFNYESSMHAQQDYKSEIYYNYNSRGERVMIQQVGQKVNITVI